MSNMISVLIGTILSISIVGGMILWFVIRIHGDYLTPSGYFYEEQCMADTLSSIFNVLLRSFYGWVFEFIDTFNDFFNSISYDTLISWYKNKLNILGKILISPFLILASIGFIVEYLIVLAFNYLVLIILVLIMGAVLLVSKLCCKKGA